MPFDFLATRTVTAVHDFRRCADGSVDYQYYRRLARQEQAQAIGRALGSAARVFTALLSAWLERRERLRMRRQFLSMDDRMLRDIGLSRVDAIQGARRAIYRP